MSQLIKMAVKSIVSNKLRAFLTMLGMIIGVSSVIILVSISQGSSKQISDQIGQLGTNLLTVNFYNTDQSKFKENDLSTIKKLSGVKEVAPVVSGRVTVKNGKTSSEVSLTGTTSSYKDVRNLKISSGRFFTDFDNDERLKTAILGSETATTLFGLSNPVGEKIQVNGTSYKVIGVLASSGSSLGQSGDNTVLLPMKVAQRLLQNTTIGSIYIQAENENIVNFAKANVESTLSVIFGESQDDFSVTNQQDVINTVSSVSNTMSIMLGGIACISLIVGGIGIMNIMLVSVSERTKEIGIRKAIGAQKTDILLQFLIESIVLSSFGGMIGVGLGVSAAKLYSMISSTSIAFSLPVILLSFTFSLLVGVIFGVFPAYKASNMRPIQALRFE
ncbi:ABC transporter permease [Gottfriedia luciferensis]|uniref:ABC transporter permease n=1 Tax=Gottfriedia luciferensis TaxID=178774 RepID=UPI001F25730A|nr:ABC transporter permease [Gottfriedia luciferensis]